MIDAEKPTATLSRWWFVVLIAAIPIGVAFYDWARAVRTAYNGASSVAWSNAAGRFLGREWPEPLAQGLTVATIETPPQAGEFAGYANATRVETVYEWHPIFHRIIGGPYAIRGDATVAILRDERGNWTPMMVE